MLPRLEVRNFAAMRIADILKVPVEPTPQWSLDEWARLRDQMREALKRELGG